MRRTNRFSASAGVMMEGNTLASHGRVSGCRSTGHVRSSVDFLQSSSAVRCRQRGHWRDLSWRLRSVRFNHYPQADGPLVGGFVRTNGRCLEGELGLRIGPLPIGSEQGRI